MVNEQILARGIKSGKLIEAFLTIPRHKFVEPMLIEQAYSDYPLPIGFGQTISQPFIIALAVDSLQLDKNSSVLEIGTGSGYQTAVLASVAKNIYTIERISKLLKDAQKILIELEYNNIFYKASDGTLGLEEFAPYDGIIVSAASPKIPEILIKQLKINGRLIIPIGDEYSQNLTLVIRKDKDKVETRNFGGCRFVKLIGKYGWEK
jgi:protein-L-isoaspartate(D-aspartate) O-methyltransferase